MKQDFKIYHGSQQIVEIPKFGTGRKYNDYGQGFYCTERIELAKEWACPIKKDGYANKYILHLDGMNVMHLTKGTFNILNWLAILLAHRSFDITSPIGNNAKEFILGTLHEADIQKSYEVLDAHFANSDLQNRISGCAAPHQE